MKDGGRGGIRTHGTVTRTPDFESGAFNHSATLPLGVVRKFSDVSHPKASVKSSQLLGSGKHEGLFIPP